MLIFLFVVLPFLTFIGLGIWYLTTPLDVLWQRREQVLMRRGLTPQRNEDWEKTMRMSGWLFIVFGFVLPLIFWTMLAPPPTKMSGTTIGGRELTQADWDACGQDISTCSLVINQR